ncbi:hypothetical protein K4749_26715 [Streptomyces sp. TRM72054]|uniref:hypothetical protein n=1 Tax=Streptomyces sp. TRM72054 TaxID=2870562 RepID=UPI001C8BB019|nr:hypothetical protein [Streptomyces sp. TRM72054]MBX9397091.1 hypothetical protein [Streptomyces sp. TRM72054]
MRNRTTKASAALAVLLAVALTGCSDSTDEGKPVESEQPTAQSPQAAPAEPKPRTAAEFLARAEEAMAGQKGWTFAVKGREGLLLQGQENAATYTATVRRTTGDPWALHSTGTTLSKGVSKPEEIYVADGTAYVKKGTAAWEHGPVTDPEFANKVEDPLAALDAFRGYGDEVTAARPDGPDGQVELRVRTTTAPLTDVRNQAVVQRALRELAPTLRQLRAAGVAAPESEIAVEGVEESLVLDASTYRLTAHTFKCTFLIPYNGQRIRYDQEVTERTSGTYDGTVALPEGVG